MVNSIAVIPHFYLSPTRTNRVQTLLRSLGALFFGVSLLLVLSRVSLPIPFSPVPLTGQTFGATLVALLFGRKLGVATILSYLGLGVLGLPISATGQVGLIGPTFGYLVGMVVSAWIVGTLADRGFTTSFKRALVASSAGTVITLSLGAAVLSYFLPSDLLMMSGVVPFIPGELIKMTLAASMATSVHRRFL